MSRTVANRVYHHLVIRADYPNTETWLGDAQGFFVQKGTGTLDTHLLPGDYAVEFGLGSTAYPIHLTNDSTFLETELRKGPTCVPPIPDISDDSE